LTSTKCSVGVGKTIERKKQWLTHQETTFSLQDFQMLDSGSGLNANLPHQVSCGFAMLSHDEDWSHK